MERNDLISIIIPIYNAEKYLSECVQSVLKQDYPYFELLLIDDGSKDNSLQICHELAKQDKRIKVIHQENGGVSVARNTGLDNAHGKYVTFIDSDDLVDPNYLSILLSHKNEDISMVVTNHVTLSPNGEISPYPFNTFFPNGENKYEDILETIIDSGTVQLSPIGSCWAILFELDLIKKNNIRFPKGIKIGEDGLFSQTYFYKAKKNIYIDVVDTPYIYRLNDNSSSNNIDVLSESMIDNETRLIELINENLKDCLPKEALDIQLYRRDITVFIQDSIYLAKAKNLTFKTFKAQLKRRRVSLGIKYMNFKKTVTYKRIILVLLKIHFNYLVYSLIKFKYSK